MCLSISTKKDLNALEALGLSNELEDFVVEVHKQLPGSWVPHHQRRLQNSCILRGRIFVCDRCNMVNLIGTTRFDKGNKTDLIGTTSFERENSSNLIGTTRLDGAAPRAPPATPKCPLHGYLAHKNLPPP